MKKRNILLACLFICISFILNNVYAYELKLSGEDKDGNGTVEFYTYVKSSGTSRTYYNDPNTIKDSEGFTKVDTTNYGLDYSAYDIMGIIFHTAPLSNYTEKNAYKPFTYLTLNIDKVNIQYPSWTSSEVINVAYADEYDKMINTSNWADYLSSNANSTYKISEKIDKNDLIKASYLIRFDSDTFDYPKYRLINKDTIVEFKYEIKTEVIQELKEKGAFKLDKDEGMYYIYFSFITQKNGTQQMETAAEFLNNTFHEGSRDALLEEYTKWNKIEQDTKQLLKNIREYNELVAKGANLTLAERYNKEALYNSLTDKGVPLDSSYALTYFTRDVEIKNQEASRKKDETKSKLTDVDLTNVGGWFPYVKGIDITSKPGETLDINDITTWQLTYGRGYSGVNDYDNRLYIPDDIITKNNDKTLYVNYLEESKTKELSVLSVAPKGKPEAYSGLSEAHQITLDKGGTWINIEKYKDYIISKDDNKEYEEYKIPIEDKKKIFRFKYMNEKELISKLEYKYQYKYLKYLSGSASDTYETLKQSILTGGGTIDKSKKREESITDNNPLLVSFIYKNTEEKTKIQVEVQHKDTNSNLLPIADVGNEYYEGGENIEKEDSSTKYIAAYKGNVKADNAFTKLLTSEYTDSYTNNQYIYNGTVQIDAYKPGSEKPDYSKKFSNKYDNFVFSTSGYANSGYIKIVITYFYRNKNTPPPTEDDDFKVCTKLEYKSNNSTITNDCNGEKNGYYPEECTDYEYVNKSLVLPTDMTFRAQIKAPYYYISDKYGIYQSINFYYEEVKITIDYKTPKIKSVATFSGVICDENSKTPSSGTITALEGYNTITDKEKREAQEVVKKYQAVSGGNQPQLFGNTIVTDEGEKTEETTSSYGGPCTSMTATGYKKYHVFKVLCAEVRVVGFKGFYLDGAEISNYDGDKTKLIGDNRENVIKAISVSNEGISANGLLNEIKSRFEYSGAVYSVNGSKYVNNNGYYNTENVTGNAFLNKLYDQPSKNSKISVGEEWINDFNSRAYDPIESGDLMADGDKFNGERLSIANVIYKNYFLIFNEKGEKAGNYYGHLRLNVKNDEKEENYNNAYNEIKKLNFSEKMLESFIKDSNNISAICSGAGRGYQSCIESIESKITAYKDAKAELEEYMKENYAGSEIVKETITVASQTNTAGINILNPATMDTPDLKSTEELVSHTMGGEKIYNLQVGVASTVTPKLAVSDNVYGNELTNKERKKYIKYYIYLFNFPIESYDKESDGWYVKKVEVGNRDSDDETLLDSAGALTFTPTGTNINKNGTSYNTSQVNIDTDRIRVIAVTKNVPNIDEALNYVLEVVGKNKNKYFTISQLVCNEKTTTNNEQFRELISLGEKIRYDANYISEVELSSGLTTTNISRVYGFRITDCTDVNYKNVFRENDAGVNKNKGVIYYSGFKELDVFTNSYSMVSDKKTTLPLGPYKHTNNTYVEAPKIGYRISFDLKTSGYYRGYLSDSNQSRKIVILPRLYYMSKDGETLLEDVNAYYKNASGKYVKLQFATKEQANSSDTYKSIANGNNILNGYQISFIPNDGYRNVLSLGITSIVDFFKSEKKIIDTSSIVLTHDMMCTNYDGFVQSWYGEFKLPNSTILVKSGETNLNNYLKDGYCGVIFYIGVVEKTSGRNIVISYNTVDKNVENQVNTTQWDYEGYLGFKNPGSRLNENLTIQLAKGTINIDTQEKYEQIKGTVVLFDLDNRAASDFE